MKKNDFFYHFFKFFIIVIFMAFVTLYYSRNNGYYEYQQYKRTIFTKEQIEKFEADVNEGRDVRLEDYLENDEVDYSNKISDFGLFLSKKISGFIKFTMDRMVDYINGSVN